VALQYAYTYAPLFRGVFVSIVKDMKIPDTKRKKTLLVIDLQPAFLRPHNRYIIPNITTLLNSVSYDAYLEALFHAEEDSLWKIQQAVYTS
jgi:hypothetical protein